MRRDSDLIRAILLAVEAEDRCEIFSLAEIAGFDDDALHFHVRLLVEKAFLRTFFPDRTARQPWLCIRLTWEGYELLDSIRDSGMPMYPGRRVMAEVFRGGAGMIVRIDAVSPSGTTVSPRRTVASETLKSSSANPEPSNTAR